MKTLKFINLSNTALLFCCALLTVGLFSEQSAAQTTISRDEIDRASYDLMMMGASDPCQSMTMVYTSTMDGNGKVTVCIMPSCTGVFQTAPIVNPGPIGSTVSGVYISSTSIPLENKAVPKQIPDSVTIGKAAAINMLLLPGQLK